MRYSATVFALLSTAMAAPFAAEARTASLCPTGLYSNPQCCATDVLGAVGLNCGVPTTTPTDTDSFIGICATRGQQAKCCVIPVAGQDVLCQDVSPGGGAPGGGSPTGGPGGPPAPTPPIAPPAESTSCESSAVATSPPTKPMKPAPSPPATTDCGC